MIGVSSQSNSDLKRSGCPSQKFYSMLPTCRTTTRMSGIESPCWRPFTDGGFDRQVDDLDVARWGIAVVLPDNFVQTFRGPVTCDPRHLAFWGSTSCSNNTAEFTGFDEALRCINFFILHGEQVRILFDSKHAARVALGEKSIALANSPHPFRPNDVVHMLWKEERQGSTGAWATSGLSPLLCLWRGKARCRGFISYSP